MNNKILLILLAFFLFFYTNNKYIENFTFFSLFKKHINADVKSITNCPKKCNLDDIEIIKIFKDKQYLKNYLKEKFSGECKNCVLGKGVLVNDKLLKKIRKKILKNNIKKKENFSEGNIANKFFNLLEKHINDKLNKCNKCSEKCKFTDYDITKLLEDNYFHNYFINKVNDTACKICFYKSYKNPKNGKKLISNCIDSVYNPK